jgi:septal ring factor EnvC (AmiA/AmiB activator)
MWQKLENRMDENNALARLLAEINNFDKIVKLYQEKVTEAREVLKQANASMAAIAQQKADKETELAEYIASLKKSVIVNVDGQPCLLSAVNISKEYTEKKRYKITLTPVLTADDAVEKLMVGRLRKAK